jgi:hypothetical protein
MQTSLCVGCKEALDRIEAGSGYRCEIERQLAVVSGVVADHVADDFPDATPRSRALRKWINSWRRYRLTLRPITVPSRMLSGEESGRAGARIVMGHRPVFSGLEREARFHAVRRLDLAPSRGSLLASPFRPAWE